MSKTLSPLEQVLVDTIQKASNVTGEIYDAARGVTTKAIDFASSQIPDIIQQLLTWKLIENGMHVLLGIAFISLFFWVRGRLKAWIIANKADSEPLHMYTVFVGAISFAAGGSLIFFNALDMLKIWFAPKIYLIEYASGLL